MSSRAQTARRAHGATARSSQSRTPAMPRRVSGPAARQAPVAAAAAGSMPRVAPAPRIAAPGVAVPARRRARTHQPPSPFARIAALPDHGLIDRLLRGRLWIWLIGLSLGGIVAMQVSLLKLNTGISRAVQASATLERQNASLQAGVARLSSGERISEAAAALGMSLPPAGSVGYVDVRPSIDGQRAARRMSPPSERARQMISGDGTAATAGAATATGAAQAAGAAIASAGATTAAPAAAGTTGAVSPAGDAATPTAAAPSVAPVPQN